MTIQVLQEMRDVGVTPDRRHHAMAMFACVTSNQCALAESIVTDLREMDAVLCTLWLRALLQQGKWTEGADLLAKMEKGREFPKPNQQTFNCLLQYQIMDHQWAAATDTLSSILRRYSATLTRIGMDGSMAGTFSALSFALGKYSSAVSRRYREDSAMGLVPYGVGTGAEITITGERVSVSVSGGVGGGVEGGVEGGMGGGGLFGINSDSDKTPATATTPTPASGVGAGASVDASVGIVGSVGGAGVRGKESEVMGGALYLEGRLSRPDPKALTFAVRSLALIGQSDNIFVQGEFYIELLKALILEGQADLAEELLDLKGSGGVRLKTEDNAQLSNIESLARRAISSGLIVPKA
ncbi:hypothetical protein B484DRAFT_416505 [Ochromonadaceae sp. CCMP2298]|nr:hypothetical protein B484DRAFT_416505 [Ochromonadaceae sp. CCMP2298]